MLCCNITGVSVHQVQYALGHYNYGSEQPSSNSFLISLVLSHNVNIKHIFNIEHFYQETRITLQDIGSTITHVLSNSFTIMCSERKGIAEIGTYSHDKLQLWNALMLFTDKENVNLQEYVTQIKFYRFPSGALWILQVAKERVMQI